MKTPCPGRQSSAVVGGIGRVDAAFFRAVGGDLHATELRQDVTAPYDLGNDSGVHAAPTQVAAHNDGKRSRPGREGEDQVGRYGLAGTHREVNLFFDGVRRRDLPRGNFGSDDVLWNRRKGA